MPICKVIPYQTAKLNFANTFTKIVIPHAINSYLSVYHKAMNLNLQDVCSINSLLYCWNFVEKHVVMMSKATGGPPNAPVAPWMFALAGRQHSEKYV